MTNLIRGHIYQLKKDRFFYGCLGIGLIFLAVSIRIFLLGFTSDTGMTSMMQTFLGGDMVLYAFMVLAANIIAEVYRSGAMKNIPYEDTEAWMEAWRNYIKVWNEKLPDVPLYSDEYYDFHSTRVQGWENTATWGWQNAVLDAWVTE